VELDSHATWTLTGYGGYIGGGGINMSSGGVLAILSGARVNAAQFNGSYGSTLEIGLDSASVTTNGQMNISGGADFGGTLDVVLENGFRPTVGEQFQLFTFGSEAGQFSALDFPPGYIFNTSQLYTNGEIIVTAVPEPVGAGLALISAAPVLWMRRRRRKMSLSLKPPIVGT
jgi:hypothetical protein